MCWTFWQKYEEKHGKANKYKIEFSGDVNAMKNSNLFLWLLEKLRVKHISPCSCHPFAIIFCSDKNVGRYNLNLASEKKYGFVISTVLMMLPSKTEHKGLRFIQVFSICRESKFFFME